MMNDEERRGCGCGIFISIAAREADIIHHSAFIIQHFPDLPLPELNCKSYLSGNHTGSASAREP